MILKVTVVVFFIGIGYFFINRGNYHPFLPPNTGEFGAFGWSGVLAGAGQIFFAYIGFDAVSTAAQEARNPKRDMPIGIIGSLAICTVLYILYGLVLTGVVNYKDLNVAAPLAVAVDHMKGLPWIGFLMKLGSLCGLTSVMLVMLLGQSRVFYSMSNDRLLPKLFPTCMRVFERPGNRTCCCFCLSRSELRLLHCEAGKSDQHRDPVRFRCRLHCGRDHAKEGARPAAPLQDAACSVSPAFGRAREFGPDGGVRSYHLGGLPDLDGYRAVDLLLLQPAYQPGAGRTR